MDILFLLIPLSLVLVFAIGGVFWWALQHRQFDDLGQQGAQILLDGDEKSESIDDRKNQPRP